MRLAYQDLHDCQGAVQAVFTEDGVSERMAGLFDLPPPAAISRSERQRVSLLAIALGCEENSFRPFFDSCFGI